MTIGAAVVLIGVAMTTWPSTVSVAFGVQSDVKKSSALLMGQHEERIERA